MAARVLIMVGAKFEQSHAPPEKMIAFLAQCSPLPSKVQPPKKTKVASPIPCPVTEVVDDSLGGELNVATPMEVESAMGSAADLEDPRPTDQFPKNSWGAPNE